MNIIFSIIYTNAIKGRAAEEDKLKLGWETDALDEYDGFSGHGENLETVDYSCTELEFKCRDESKCIDIDAVCDKTEDCDDGSDEYDCPGEH